MVSITGISRRLRQRQAVTLMEGIRSAIEQWRSDLVPGLISRHQKILGSPQQADSLANVLTGRLDNQLSHSEASAALADAARSLSSRHSAHHVVCVGEPVPSNWLFLGLTELHQGWIRSDHFASGQV